MAAYMVLIQKNFPSATDDIYDYIQGALETGIDDFVTANDVYEEIGEILERLNDKKTEADIRDICGSIFSLLKPNHKTDNKLINGQIKKLNTPVDMNAPNDTNESLNAVQAIWMNKVEFPMQVDIKKLAKAKAKLEQKQVKREVANSLCTSQHKVPITKTATASQVTSKKEAKLESKGTNRSNDIRIENFDVAFGEKILLQNTDITLAFGRRYGLVGRNGLGKTTLLRMISSGQLRIPSHIRILHVEQEVVGNDTLALQSVLECDTELQKLIKREKEITAELNNDSTNVKLNAELSELYAKFESMDADKAIVKGSVILAGLGFTPEMQKKATKHFSGGWRMRLALARALFSRPDLLLLDEPTNMLDMKAIIWLESYLQTWPTTLLVVSHDRHFLDTVPTDILHFHSQRIDTYKGNYECFEKTRIDRLKSQQRELDAQVAQRAHIQEFIDKFRYNANRASSVQSKIKVLEKLPELKPIEKDSTVVLKFPDTDGLSPPIIQIDEMAFSYSSTTPLLSNITLSANLDSRICIVGDNGTGKTTLLKLVMGALEPSKGTIYVHRNLKFGYFSQHHVDQLDMNVTCVDLLKATSPGKQIEEYRRILGSFGITGDLSLQFVGTLSGGQKSRVAFARMCLSSPNFLILDEPTNHLDIETIEALGKAINKYKGGVILVSHDERLIRKVCKELWVCGNGTVKSIEGGFEEYRMIVEKEIAESSK